MRENFNYTNADQDNDNIDFAKLFRFILMQSKLILSMVFISFFISLALYITADKNYKITSLIQVDTDNTDILDITNTLGNINASTEIPNLITLYKSRTNILKLINDLKMNIDIKNIEYKSMIDINFKELDNSNEISTTIYLENILDKINVFDENKDLIGQYKENEKFEYKGLVISIDRFNKSIKERIEIDYKSPSLLYPAIKQKLVLESNSARNSWYQSREGLIEVSYVTNDVAEGKNIINYANKIFLDYRVLVETEKARKAIDFIDKNIESLKKILDSNKRRLKDFREKNQSINVDLEIQKVIERIQSIDNELDGVEIELANAADRYTENNPIFLNLIKKREILATQKEDILVQINRLPKEQQDYIDLFNEVENSQEVFEELESRRLGFSIIEASTMGNVRIVDDAYKAYLVSPQLINVLITPIIFFLFGCILAIFRGFNFLPITNPAELFDNNLNQPITGVIPLIEDTSDTSSNHQLNSSIESLIVNLRSIKSDNNDKKVISISSPSPANGKSLISKLLAEKLASIGSRVMLIDNDLKRGQLTKIFGKKNIKKDVFYDLSTQNIEHLKTSENLYLVPRLKGLANSFQFLCDPTYQDKINELKNDFDYVIYDTAPILSVADTSVLVAKSDINFVVVRHSLSKINEIKQCADIYTQINSSIDGFIYNAYSKPKGYYGYYGLYGNYSYQYYADKYLDETYEYKK